MASARNVLERSTIMLLTSTKLCLRHPDCVHSKENRDTVFCQMRRAMDLIHHVIKDGILSASNERRIARGGGCASGGGSGGGEQSSEWDTHRATASSCLRFFARLMECSRPQFNTAITNSNMMPKSSLKDVSKSRSESLHSTEHDDIINERRELMRSNSERDRHGTNSHHNQHHHSHQPHHSHHHRSATADYASYDDLTAGRGDGRHRTRMVDLSERSNTGGKAGMTDRKCVTSYRKSGTPTSPQSASASASISATTSSSKTGSSSKSRETGNMPVSPEFARPTYYSGKTITSTSAGAAAASSSSSSSATRNYFKERSDIGYMSKNEAVNIEISILSPQTRE